MLDSVICSSSSSSCGWRGARWRERGEGWRKNIVVLALVLLIGDLDVVAFRLGLGYVVVRGGTAVLIVVVVVVVDFVVVVVDVVVVVLPLL